MDRALRSAAFFAYADNCLIDVNLNRAWNAGGSSLHD
jgi:hypothetical protein